eukprot:Sdes_comp19292_c0_seq1m10345
MKHSGNFSAHNFQISLGLKKLFSTSFKSPSSLKPAAPFSSRLPIKHPQNPQQPPEFKNFNAHRGRVPIPLKLEMYDYEKNYHNAREYFLNPDFARGVFPGWLPQVEDAIEGFRQGELIIFTGPTGFGKTTLLAQLTLQMGLQGHVLMWASFEIPNWRLQATLTEQVLGARDSPKLKSFYKDDEKKFDAIFDECQFFLQTHVKLIHHDYEMPFEIFLKSLEFTIKREKIPFLLIDNLQYLVARYAHDSLSQYEIQDKIIVSLRELCNSCQCTIFLVAHLRKITSKSCDETDVNALYGSVRVSQEADIILGVHQSGDFRAVSVLKNRHNGKIGPETTCEFIYDLFYKTISPANVRFEERIRFLPLVLKKNQLFRAENSPQQAEKS